MVPLEDTNQRRGGKRKEIFGDGLNGDEWESVKALLEILTPFFLVILNNT